MERPFVVQASTLIEARNKVKDLFGAEAMIRSCRTVQKGGFLGFFGHEEVEISGYVSPTKDNEKEISDNMIIYQDQIASNQFLYLGNQQKMLLK